LSAAGKHQAEAAAFLEFLASAQAAAIFKKYGFTRAQG
jgi:ABC-type molybdate transport system substrate-binding protein